MAKPFVSHDGPDANGVRAEVYVQVGTGTVKELSESGQNVQVKFDSDLLQYPVGGWFAKSEPFYQSLIEAKESGREVAYRVESQRKAGVDRSLPIAPLRKTTELAKENCINVVASVDGVMSSEAVTNPAEDTSGGRIRAGATPSQSPRESAGGTGGGFLSVEQALAGLTKAREGGLPPSIIDSACALALAAGASVQQVMSAGVSEQGDGEARQVQRAHAVEAAPFHAFNTDGRLNLGSYSVQAAVGAESLALDLMWADELASVEKINAAVDAGEHEGPKVTANQPNFKSAALLGVILLELADRVQVAAYGGGRPDRQASSHTRARSLVYDAIKNRHPVPFGQTDEAREAWKEAVVDEATTRFRFAATIASTEHSPAPAEPSNEPGDQPGEKTDAVNSPEVRPAGSPQQAQAPQQETPAPQAQAPQQETPAPQAQAPQQETPGEVRQIGTANAARPKAPVEGDEGFVAPSEEVLHRFGSLALAAGFEPKPNSPISAYLMAKFGVTAARKVHGEALATLVDWYENAGPAGAQKFQQHVMAEASQRSA